MPVSRARYGGASAAATAVVPIRTFSGAAGLAATRPAALPVLPAAPAAVPAPPLASPAPPAAPAAVPAAALPPAPAACRGAAPGPQLTSASSASPASSLATRMLDFAPPWAIAPSLPRRPSGHALPRERPGGRQRVGAIIGAAVLPLNSAPDQAQRAIGHWSPTCPCPGRLPARRRGW